MSVWSEICTREQVFLDLESSEKPTKLLVPNLFGKDPYIVPVKEGGVLEAMRLVQKLKGLPASKIMRRPIYNEDHEVICQGFIK